MLKKLLIVSLLVACVVCLQEQGVSDLRKAQSSAHSFLKFTKDQVAGLVGSKDPKAAKRDISDICPVFNCAKNGASCAPVLSKKPIIAYICTEGFCDTDTTACTAYKANGTSCDDDEQCQSSYCMQGRCAEPPSYPNPGDIGDTCEQNGDCYSLNCTNKVCVGKGLGDQCGSDSECNEGLWCSKPSESDKSGTCAGPIPEESACRMQHSGSCTEGTFCGLKDNKLVCISKFSTTVGSTCIDDMDCPDLTYCDYSKSTDDTQYGSCANGPTMSSNKLCNSSSACSSFESCKCNVLIGKRTCQLNYADVSVNPTGARAAIQNAYNCYFQKCSGKFDSTCLTQTCNKEFCDYIDFSITNAKVRMLQYSPKCLVDTLADQLRDIGGGFFSGICPAPTGNPTEAPAVIQSVSLVVAGSCGDANSATIRAALTSQFSVKGDIKCTNMQTSRKRAVKSVSAQYTASLSTAISSDAATSQLAAASAQMQTQGVTVLKAESSAQASQPDQVNTSSRVLIGVLSLLCVFIALI